ncbi:membrane hypothetical protein [Sphingomonas sp. EC-HK361]|uniref:hypothetical protein n=1 Tax=Sphingomonas sp. EC-HK361 TaxID=2038397 RepID=UPI001256C2E9|nr:hypothetical protein [Sphingomonas sp. EC-HK361]VVT13210.1 membrane hypothetical protein [Sphingomonas sp. EC-HK361]
MRVAALLLLWLAASAVGWNLSLNNDVSWQYWVARQLIGGARFYTDITESNPPLWFWEAVPVTWAADRLHVAARHLAVALVMAQTMLAIGLVGALSPGKALWRSAGATLILLTLPLFDFGERDHLMAIGALPYVLLAARRVEGRLVDRRIAIVVAALAAAGFALKPHFLVVPIAIEAWVALRLGKGWRIVRPETATVAAILVLYALAVAILTPAYFTHQLPLVLSAYGEFKPPFARVWTQQIYLPCWIVGAAALILARQRSAATASAGVAAMAFAAVYTMQGKGFPYHALPVTIGVAWACWLLLERERRLAPRLLAIAAIGGALLTAALVGPFKPSRIDPITARIEALPPGATYALISTHSWDAFPLIEDRRLIWPMRGFLLWTMPAIARDPSSPIAATTRREIAQDLWCHPPDAILFDDPARSPAMPRNGFDYRRFVLGDPSARALLANYRLTDRVGGATLWTRTSPLAPRGSDCRAISIRPDYR